MANITVKGTGKNYEIVTFNARSTNKGVTVSGIGLAQGYLAIADAYRIYNTVSGEPVLRCRFQTLDDCLEFAEDLERVYKDYFDIWRSEPKADLILWVRYTIPEGLYWFNVKEILDRMNVVTHKDIQEAKLKAKSV